MVGGFSNCIISPEPISVAVASTASLLHTAICSVLPAERGAVKDPGEAAAIEQSSMLLLEGAKNLPGKPILIFSLHTDIFFPVPPLFLCLDKASDSADQSSTAEEQAMTSADSRMDKAHLSVAGEIPVESFLLTTDKIRTAQEKLSVCQNFLAELAKFDAAKFLELEQSKVQ